MTARELIEELEWAMEQNGGDVEIRFASQPKWPFEYSVENAVTVSPNHCDGEKVVYLVEGTQLDYLNETAQEKIGW